METARANRPLGHGSYRKGYGGGGPQGRVLVEERAETTSAQSLKGGDPAAGSPTATLLRLHPSR